jgi:hypothetical protein
MKTMATKTSQERRGEPVFADALTVDEVIRRLEEMRAAYGAAVKVTMPDGEPVVGVGYHYGWATVVVTGRWQRETAA